MKFLFLLLLVITGLESKQQTISGIIADSSTGQPLAFATIKAERDNKTVFSGISGEFSLKLSIVQSLNISHIGFSHRTIFSSGIKNGDTIFLVPSAHTMDPVVIRSQTDKIARIIEQVVRNRDLNNPDKYRQYECYIYYKMSLDMGLMDNIDPDSLKMVLDKMYGKKNKQDTADLKQDTTAPVDMHMLLVETYTKRIFKRPQVQEIVMASKLSGVDKTYFPNVVTEMLPFHLYTNLISLNGKEYVNPMARGWQEKYRIILEDEIIMNQDTVFMLSFKPRDNTHFNSLSGIVYINSNGYAISHMAASNTSKESMDRLVKFEHVYSLVNGRWFPRELNYDLLFKRVPFPFLQFSWNGRSIIDPVDFENISLNEFDKTHPIKLHDSVDLRTEQEWNVYRQDTMSTKERNTYIFIDSMIKQLPVKNIMLMTARIPSGLIPLGKIDVDVKRIIAHNQYEGYRFGLGLYTNTAISKYFATGAWAGYGLRDDKWKYGYDLIFYPKANRDQSFGFSFTEDYRIPGQFEIHPELSKKGLRNWLFRQVDRVKEYSVTANIRAGYWQFNPVAAKTTTRPLHYIFSYDGKHYNRFDSWKYSIGIRYVYNEKRYPFFDYYLPSGTPKYPVIYFRLGTTGIRSGAYQANVVNANAAVTWQTKNNKWGKDQFYLEAGMLKTNDVLPKSFLFGGNGTRRTGINYYNFGSFITMKPFEYYSNKYISFIYSHDFYKYFWSHKWSKPFLSISHNLVYGKLDEKNKMPNNIYLSFEKGYHESGIMLKQILRRDIRIADFNVNGGLFYHWTNKWEKKNALWVVGAAMSF